MRTILTKKNNYQSGSMLLIVIFGLAQISTLLILSLSYMKESKKASASINTSIEVENYKTLLNGYLSSDQVCTAHLGGQSLLTEITIPRFYYTNVVSPDARSIDNSRPMRLVNDKISNLSVLPVNASHADSTTTTKLNFEYLPEGAEVEAYGSIELKVDLDASSRIVRCRANIQVDSDSTVCSRESEGKIIYSQSEKIPRVCDGTRWIPAVSTAGTYGFMTNSSGGIGMCAHPNRFSGTCACITDFQPVLIHDFTSSGCSGRYYQYGRGAGCGAKVVECRFTR